MNTPKTAEAIYEKRIGTNMEMQYLPTPKENVMEAMKEFSAQQSREKSIAFHEFVDRNYINYQMQEGKYYHKRDLLKHISEATIYTTAELYDGPYQKYLIEQAKNKENV